MAVIRSALPVTLEEVCEPFELAPSLEVFEYLLCMTALTLDRKAGVRWYCRICRFRETTSTLLTRPLHCGDPMEVEAWVSLSQIAANVQKTVDLRGVVR